MFKTLLKKTFEWRNLHSEWRCLHSEWSLFFNKKTFLKKMNGEISIQNVDFSILNGENSLQSFFLKFKTRLKNIWMEKSPFRMEISPFWTEKTLCRVFFKIKFKTLLKKNKWINLHSEWRFLHSEWRKLSVEFVFQKKSSKRFWRKWKEKSPF